MEHLEVAPPRRPNHLKILAGVREDRINRNEPLPAESAIVPPVKLSPEAQRVWDRLAPDLIDQGVLSAWDTGLFALYCDAEATYFECRAALGADFTTKGSVKNTEVKSPLWRIMRDCEASMRAIGAKFGLTPADRAGLDVSESAPPSKYGPERILG